MKESMSRDWFKLAGVALHAAIRDRGDLLALLNDCANSSAARASTAALFTPPQTAFPTTKLPATHLRHHPSGTPAVRMPS
jgi:hypothetical protein